MRDTVKTICTLAAGDARSALTTLELASEIAVTRPDTEGTPAPAAGERYPITVDDVKIANPRRGFSYDKNGDMHYDIISAFIKSMRGSDPDATIYWLARMIDAGEDPKFIARRIMIQASEDVGNADPQALLVAQAAFKSAEVIGYPECRINLAQAALYVCLAPKSNACEASIDAALADIHSSGLREVPSYLRDRHRPGSDEYGVYKYPHDYPEGWVDQRYLPEGLERGAFWQPAGRGWENGVWSKVSATVAAMLRSRSLALRAFPFRIFPLLWGTINSVCISILPGGLYESHSNRPAGACHCRRVGHR